ncbi:Methionine--tRNA ligase [Dirofilaria immitis]
MHAKSESRRPYANTKLRGWLRHPRKQAHMDASRVETAKFKFHRSLPTSANPELATGFCKGLFHKVLVCLAFYTISSGFLIAMQRYRYADIDAVVSFYSSFTKMCGHFELQPESNYNQNFDMYRMTHLE